jgi:hypothetical protein
MYDAKSQMYAIDLYPMNILEQIMYVHMCKNKSFFQLPPEAHPGHPDHRPKTTPQMAPPPHQVVTPHAAIRREAPPKYPRVEQREEKRVAFTSPGGSTYRSNSSSSDESLKREIVYSVDNYRNSAKYVKQLTAWTNCLQP